LCESVQEWTGSYKDKPEHLACSCGGQALQLLCTNHHIKRSFSGPSGQELFSRLAERSVARDKAAEAGIKKRDRRAVETARKRRSEMRGKAHGSTSIRHVAELPARYVHEMMQAHGKDFFTDMTRKDLKKVTKKDGLWLAD